MANEAYSVYDGTLTGYGAGGYGHPTGGHTRSKGGYARAYDTVATSTITIAAGVTYTNSSKTITTANSINYDVSRTADGTYNMYLYQNDEDTTALKLVDRESDRYVLENKQPLQQYFIPVNSYEQKTPSDDVLIGRVTILGGIVIDIEKQTLNLNSGVGEAYAAACMPDYSTAVTFTPTAAGVKVPYNGYLVGDAATAGAAGTMVWVNDIKISREEVDYAVVQCLVNKDDIVKISGGSSAFYLCALKGTKQ